MAPGERGYGWDRAAEEGLIFGEFGFFEADLGSGYRLEVVAFQRARIDGMGIVSGRAVTRLLDI